MAEYYQIPENPQYNPEHIRKLQNSDPASAEDTFNPLVERILENIAAVHDSGGGGSDLKLHRLYIDTQPKKTAYKAGETFDPAGMVVKGDYSLDGTVVIDGREITNYSYYPMSPLSAGTVEVTVSASGGGVALTAAVTVEVTKTSVAKPAVKGSYTYNTNVQTAEFDNYDPSLMAMGGEFVGENAGEYTATFALLAPELYEWDDGSTEPVEVVWSIGRVTPTLTATPESLTLDRDHPTASAVISTDGDGELSVSSSNPEIVAELAGMFLTVSGVGKNGNAALTVSHTGGTNYEDATLEILVEAKFAWIYGYDLVKADENPDTRVGYPDDVDNAGFTPARMDFDADVFRPGGWTLAPGEDFMPRPCMLKFDGTVDYYLDPNDYTKRADNGKASDVADINYGGNAMIEWPKIYAKRWDSDDGKIYHFRCSNERLDDDYECWSNYDKNNQEIDHFYTPIFFGSKDSFGRLRSISGQANWTSTGGAAKVIDAAKLNGTDIWYVEVTADIFLIQDLLVTLFKSTDLQTALGKGVCSGSAVATGTMNDKGLFWGVTANTTTGVKAFGREHSWGNLWYYAAGWVCDHGAQKFKLTRGTKDGTAVTDYNLDGNGYLAVSGATPANGTGYISSCVTQRFGRVPAVISGTATTYECDGIIMDNTTNAYVYVGGNSARGDLNGPFFACLQQPPSYSYSTVGAALSCKPRAKP